MKWISRPLLALAVTLAPAAAGAVNPASDDSSHGFDYQVGQWRVQVSRLLDPLTAAQRWTHYDGTHTVTPLMGGRANIGVLEISGPSGQIEGLQLRLYDAATQQWKLSFANGNDGVIGSPSAGRFENGQGTFYSSEQIAGHDARVRTVATRLGETIYRDVISFSTLRDKVWHPMWIATYTRIGDAAAGPVAETAGNRDFDFQIGTWRAHLERLAIRLHGSRTWRDYDGTLTVRRLWNGRANVGELDVRTGGDRIVALLVRTYDRRTGQWSDYTANLADGSVEAPPATGRLTNGHGELYDRETFDGRPIVVRGVFDKISAQSCRFVQSFSADGGKTWEPNLIARFRRLA
ncbi:MAG TPA: hypothetical protein VGI19_06845 [Candidatus Cybelea sp.]|jgi:hypothetical protein